MKQPQAWRFALAWVAVMAGLVFASPLWREADWWLFARQVRAEVPPLRDDLVLLDVPWDADVAIFRRRLLLAIDQLAALPKAPAALIFDVQFVKDPRVVDELLAALQRLRDRQTRLFAVVGPAHEERLRPGFMLHHERRIYETALDGHGHTAFETAAGVITYEPMLALGNGESVPALAVRVAATLFPGSPAPGERPIVVRLGRTEDVAAVTLRLDPARGTVSGPKALADLAPGRIVVIGALDADLPLGAGQRTGPEYLLWALSARAMSEHGEARLAADPRLLLALVLAAGLLAAGLARAVWAAFPRSHSRPWIIGVAAAAGPVVALAIVAAALAGADLHLPQITLPMLAALLAGTLAAWFARRYLDWRWTVTEPPPIASEYDVFVSYSRTDPRHGTWVQQQVVEPLERARRPDGEPFSVFIDREGLHPGDAWLQRLYHAIDASRFFVPVYSADYFRKDYCQRELNHALHRQRADATFIVGVDVAGGKIPSPYDTYQTLAAGPDAGPVGPRLVDALTRALHADEAVRRAQAATAESAPGSA